MKKELEKLNCNNCKKCGLGRYCPKLAEKNTEYKKMMDNEVQNAHDYFTKFAEKTKIEKAHCCDDFDSQWIEYPFVIDKIETEKIDYSNCLFHKVGSLVKIRPCGDEYHGKTYLGFLVGDLPTEIISNLYTETSTLNISTMKNPAIFVPELKKIIFGYESWWGEIKSEEELKEITNDDIDNVWYIKILKNWVKNDD